MRKIVHIDMDSFYAAIEQRDNSRYRGKPIIVGGPPNGRGVVATASYEARAFGIHSAMPSAQAIRLCPSAIFVRPRMGTYIRISREIHSIFYKYTGVVESLGLDEAFLDVTTNTMNSPSATRVACKIRQDIESQTGLTASAGVSYNKFLAKLASDLNKPNGMAVITPNTAQDFIDKLPIGAFHGIGKSIEGKMIKLGIKTGRDLRGLSKLELIRHFGKAGVFYFKIAHGRDDRPVLMHRDRKSVGAERTFSADLKRISDIDDVLKTISQIVAERLKKLDVAGKTITVKVRYSNFETITRSQTLYQFISDPNEIWEKAKTLVKTTEAGEREIRLLGVTISNLNLVDDKKDRGYQPELPFLEWT